MELYSTPIKVKKLPIFIIFGGTVDKNFHPQHSEQV